MEQAKFYNILINPNGDICIILKPVKPYIGMIDNPEIIYDGGDNAFLYRNSNSMVLLDYIPKEQQRLIFDKEKILVVEYDLEGDKVVNEYFAFVIKVKKMLDLGSNFVDRESLNVELKNLGLL